MVLKVSPHRFLISCEGEKKHSDYTVKKLDNKKYKHHTFPGVASHHLCRGPTKKTQSMTNHEETPDKLKMRKVLLKARG